MTVFEEYQTLIRELEDRSISLEKKIVEVREQGMQRINQTLDSTHVLLFENGEYKVRAYLKNKGPENNYSFVDGHYYYTATNGRTTKFGFLSKILCSIDKHFERYIANDICTLQKTIEIMDEEKNFYLQLANTAKCREMKLVDIRQFFIDLFYSKVQISSELKFHLFGKLIARNHGLYKANPKIARTDKSSILEERLMEAYSSLSEYFDKKGNIILHGPVFTKNDGAIDHANRLMFENCFSKNLQYILSDDSQSAKKEDADVAVMMQSLRNSIYYISETQYSALLQKEIAKKMGEKQKEIMAKSEARQSKKEEYQKQQEAIAELATYWNGEKFIQPCYDLVHFNDLLLLTKVNEEQRSILVSKMERYIIENKKYRYFTLEQKKIYLEAKETKENQEVAYILSEIEAALELLEQIEDPDVKEELNRNIMSLQNIMQ